MLGALTQVRRRADSKVMGDRSLPRLRVALLTGIAIIVAGSTASFATTPAPPKTQVLQLAASQGTLMPFIASVSQPVGLTPKLLLAQLTAKNACNGAIKAIPESKARYVTSHLVTGYEYVSLDESIAQVIVADARAVGALHLTAPVLRHYVAALNGLAAKVTPLAKATLPRLCTVFNRAWKLAGYNLHAVSPDTLWGISRAQRQVLVAEDSHTTIYRVFARAGEATRRYASTLGVAFNDKLDAILSVGLSEWR